MAHWRERCERAPMDGLCLLSAEMLIQFARLPETRRVPSDSLGLACLFTFLLAAYADSSTGLSSVFLIICIAHYHLHYKPFSYLSIFLGLLSFIDW